MPIQVFQHVKDAIRNLDPEDIRKHTERPSAPVALRRQRSSNTVTWKATCIPRDLSAAKRAQVRRIIYRRSAGAGPRVPGDLEIYFDPAQIRTSATPTFLDSTLCVPKQL